MLGIRTKEMCQTSNPLILGEFFCFQVCYILGPDQVLRRIIAGTTLVIKFKSVTTQDRDGRIDQMTTSVWYPLPQIIDRW